MSRVSILSQADSNGNTKFGYNGGLGLLVAWGTFGGATVALNLSPLTDDDSILIAAQDAAAADVEFTADGLVGFYVAPGFDYYLTITGATGPTLINADISDSSGVN